MSYSSLRLVFPAKSEWTNFIGLFLPKAVEKIHEKPGCLGARMPKVAVRKGCRLDSEWYSLSLVLGFDLFCRLLVHIFYPQVNPARKCDIYAFHRFTQARYESFAKVLKNDCILYHNVLTKVKSKTGWGITGYKFKSKDLLLFAEAVLLNDELNLY